MCHPLTDSSGVPINSSPLANTSDTSTTTRPLVSATSGPSISQPSTSTVPTPSSNSTGNTFPTTPWTSANQPFSHFFGPINPPDPDDHPVRFFEHLIGVDTFHYITDQT
jgi:hypothetical protein